MVAQSLTLPDVKGYDFGVGLDRLSGTIMNQAVEPTPSPPMLAAGATFSFSISRITSSTDLQKSLGIDIEANYGCASFGAGASARFKFADEQHVNSENLYMTITTTIKQANQSIDHPILTNAAQGLVANNPKLFDVRYGDLFARACSNGGVFVGVLRVETSGAESARAIETGLHGAYGGFTFDGAVNFREAVKKANAAAYFEIYTEGGPAITVTDPTNPMKMIEHANYWVSEMRRDPVANSRPYEWYFSPLTIAEGPAPLNAVEIEHARDVLMICARARSGLVDMNNRLAWIVSHQSSYNWDGSATFDEVVAALQATQADLDLIASCASNAIEHPGEARTPAKFATDNRTVYPTAKEPRPLPEPRPGSTPVPTADTPFDWRKATLVRDAGILNKLDISKLLDYNK